MEYTIATTCKDPKVKYWERAPWLRSNGFKFNWSNKYWYKITTKTTALNNLRNIMEWDGWHIYTKQNQAK